MSTILQKIPAVSVYVRAPRVSLGRVPGFAPAAVSMIVLAFGSTLTGCSPNGTPPARAPSVTESTPTGDIVEPMVLVDLPAELDRVLRDYEAGWQASDADALARLFADDGFILRPGHPPVRGRAEIAEAYAGSGGPLHLHAFEYATEDSVGYIIGGFRSAPDRPDAGKFILTVRRLKDGRWYITADMDNGNR